MSEYTKGTWIYGWNGGLTGPRTPSIAGPTCAGRGVDNWFPVSRGMDCVAIAVGDTAMEACANARLIASAPDLLEALKGFMPNADGTITITPESLASARAALEKAEGKYPARAIKAGEMPK